MQHAGHGQRRGAPGPRREGTALIEVDRIIGDAANAKSVGGIGKVTERELLAEIELPLPCNCQRLLESGMERQHTTDVVEIGFLGPG